MCSGLFLLNVRGRPGMIPTDVRSDVRRVPVAADDGGAASGNSLRQCAACTTPDHIAVDLRVRSDVMDAGAVVFGEVLASETHTVALVATVAAVEAPGTVAANAQADFCTPLSSWRAGADSFPDDLTLSEIAVILTGTQDHQCPDTPAERHAAGQVTGLVTRVKECTRCVPSAPAAQRPSQGTTSTSCPRHLVLDQIHLLQRSHTTLPVASQAAAVRNDEMRLGRLLSAVAQADGWSVHDWAQAARTLRDATLVSAQLRDAPVIRQALVLCATAVTGRGEGI